MNCTVQYGVGSLSPLSLLGEFNHPHTRQSKKKNEIKVILLKDTSYYQKRTVWLRLGEKDSAFLQGMDSLGTLILTDIN